MDVISGWRKWAICIWTLNRPSYHHSWSWTPSDSHILWICMPSRCLWSKQDCLPINIFISDTLLLQVGHMIQAESDSQKRDEYLQRLMELPNQVFVCLICHMICWMFFLAAPITLYVIFIINAWWFCFLQKWLEIIGQAHQNVEFLKDQDVIRTVLNILQVHLSNQWSTFLLSFVWYIYIIYCDRCPV